MARDGGESWGKMIEWRKKNGVKWKIDEYDIAKPKEEKKKYA